VLLYVDCTNSGGSKDDKLAKRLSTTRKKHATPSLSLQASRPAPVTKTASKSQPFIIDEDDDDASASIVEETLPVLPSAPSSQQKGHPLQEVSPNCSPRKGSQPPIPPEKAILPTSETLEKPSSRTVSPEKATSEAMDRPSSRNPTPDKDGTEDPADVPAPVIEPDEPKQVSYTRPQEEITADLTELLNRQTAARLNAGSAPPPKRKNRPLGRNISSMSNRSLSASAPEEPQTQTASQAADAAIDGFTAPMAKSEPVPPSTQLGYDTPESETHRAQISKRMGVGLMENSGLKRVASLGTVKDSPLGGSDAGVGARVKRRQGTR